MTTPSTPRFATATGLQQGPDSPGQRSDSPPPKYSFGAPLDIPVTDLANTSRTRTTSNVPSIHTAIQMNRSSPEYSDYSVDLSKSRTHVISNNPGSQLSNLLSPVIGPTAAASLKAHSNLIESSVFIVLCLLWYMASSVTSNIAKELLNVFKYPLTLSWIQFLFVAAGCFIISSGQRFLVGVKGAGIRFPTIDAFKTTAPLALFLISGHAFSSMAISRVPVSFAHTIKALSPLFTIGIYRFVFKVKYAAKVYVSLLPLTIGVMFVCTNKLTFHWLGFLCALTSTVIFVVQNIVSKSIFDNQHKAKQSKKMDKYNLLFYSSVTSFMLMTPLWFYADGLSMFGGDSKTAPSFGPLGSFSNTLSPSAAPSGTPNLATQDTRITAPASQIARLFFVNGVSHFAQAALSFTILAQVHNPVTFSIASLFKRIVVIVASIVYFGETKKVGLLQWFGLVLTFIGLYMYDRAKMEVKGDRSHGEDVEFVSGKRKHVLPV